MGWVFTALEWKGGCGSMMDCQSPVLEDGLIEELRWNMGLWSASLVTDNGGHTGETRFTSVHSR